MMTTVVAGLGFTWVSRGVERTAREVSSVMVLTDSAQRVIARVRAAVAAPSGAAGIVRPEALAEVEQTYVSALAETRRQELRPTPLRDYSISLSLLRDVIDSGEGLAGRSERRLEGVLRDARAALAAADAALDPLRGIEDEVWVEPSVRARLQRARQLAEEGAHLVTAGSPDRGVEKARAARQAATTVAAAISGSLARFVDEDQIAVWRSWQQETIRRSAETGEAAIVVDKDAHRMTLYRAGRAVKTYTIDLGWNDHTDKVRQGDGATPEGRYRVRTRKGPSESRYHRAFLLDYPNAQDERHLAELKARGAVPANTRPGGLIEIHGNGGRGRDWTDGCVAVTDREMDELFDQIPVGTPVTIVGSLTGDGEFARVVRRLGS